MDQNLVPPHGSRSSKIAIVGEAPGKDEHLYKIPFIGASGELLGRYVRRAGYQRQITKKLLEGHIVTDVVSNVYVTNFVKYYPGPDFKKQFYSDSKGLEPNGEWLRWQQVLQAELKACSANVIVPVGEHAMRAITGKYGISNWRGSILESTLLPGRKAIPVVHPANVLREWYYHPICLIDWQRIGQESLTPDIVLPAREYHIRPTFEQVKEWEEILVKAEYVACDIETKYGHVACVGFADRADRAFCIPFISNRGHYWPDAQIEAAVWRTVYNALAAPSKKIFQNGLFDLSRLSAMGMRVNNFWHDTMLGHALLYPELEKSLAVQTSLYTREPYYKSEGKQALNVKSDKAWGADQRDDQLWIYNCKDCAVTWEICFEQLKDFTEVERVSIKSSGGMSL